MHEWDRYSILTNVFLILIVIFYHMALIVFGLTDLYNMLMNTFDRHAHSERDLIKYGLISAGINVAYFIYFHIIISSSRKTLAAK